MADIHRSGKGGMFSESSGEYTNNGGLSFFQIKSIWLGKKEKDAILSRVKYCMCDLWDDLWSKKLIQKWEIMVMRHAESFACDSFDDDIYELR